MRQAETADPATSCPAAYASFVRSASGAGRERRVWALDADLAAAFDRIDHDHLLAAIGSFPARDLISGLPRRPAAHS